MTLLAIDTATQFISIALHDGQQMLAEQTWISENHHTVELAPAVRALLINAHMTPAELSWLAVSIGPGSYTGLRIGVALAKGIATAQRIPLVAYSPLAKGKLGQNPVLETIARKHGASAAQVALKWLLDQDSVCAIPKAARRESQQANLDALKLNLDDEDRKAIAALPKDRRCVNPGFAPAWD